MIYNNRDVYLEIITMGDDGPICSELVDPTYDDIEEMINKPCDHDNQTKNLIYDVSSYLYDIRKCAVCRKILGRV